MSGMSLCPAFRHCLRSLRRQFFVTIALMLKNPCQQLCSFSLAPCQRSYACPVHGPGFENFGRSWAHSFSEQSYWCNLSWKTGANSSAFLASLPANQAICSIAQRLQITWKILGAKFFGTIALMEFVLKTRANSSASQCVALSPSYFHGSLSIHPLVASVSLLHKEVLSLPKLFPTVSRPSTLSSLRSRSFPTNLSPCYFPRFPVHPPCRRFNLAPSQRSSPHAISNRFPSVHPVVASRRFHVASSPRSSPQAISHGFPSVHPVVAPVSRTRCPVRPSTLSSLQYRFIATELSPSYFPPFRPPCRRFHLAPSPRNSPQAISHGFPCVHPVVASISLLPHGSLPKLFPTVSIPSTLSSLPSRSFPTELSTRYFPRFPVRHPLVASISLLPNEPIPMLLPTVSRPSTLSPL